MYGAKDSTLNYTQMNISEEDEDNLEQTKPARRISLAKILAPQGIQIDKLQIDVQIGRQIIWSKQNLQKGSASLKYLLHKVYIQIDGQIGKQVNWQIGSYVDRQIGRYIIYRQKGKSKKRQYFLCNKHSRGQKHMEDKQINR